MDTKQEFGKEKLHRIFNQGKSLRNYKIIKLLCGVWEIRLHKAIKSCYLISNSLLFTWALI